MPNEKERSRFRLNVGRVGFGYAFAQLYALLVGLERLFDCAKPQVDVTQPVVCDGKVTLRLSVVRVGFGQLRSAPAFWWA